MTISYQISTDPADESQINHIVKKDSRKGGPVLQIPLAEANVDYQEYLAWFADGNTAEAADRYDSEGNKL